ncbi:MAG: phosphate ABC transporter substrate-binding/OmpA family protein [Saprospiraceae bacterium]|nr:phosphate ABC transporter substrate-binding/OmpA family protein [Saprospiraceae bacterium]MDZ4703804.1 phosphate ABC transporter substrate-binding/OmpA family protein [Saprospiraceae bacterium]
MAARLTTFSKLLIVLAVLGGTFFGLKYSGVLDGAGDGTTEAKEEKKSSGKSSAGDDDVIKVGVVTWGGYAGGQYFNEGFEASAKSRFSKEYGIDVEFKVLDDFEASRNAFKADEVNLLWQTIDAFPTEVNGLADFDPVVVFQSDWSRGGDAVVARPGITKVSDLKGKKVAVAELTPSHSFLLWLLEAGGLTAKDIEIVAQPNAIDAAEVFKSRNVDAAVVWSPDDILCTKAVPGSRILESTRSASFIIADVFLAKREYAEKNKAKLQKLYEGWMRGAAEINASKESRRKAAQILAEEFTERGTALSTDEADQMIGNVRLVTHGDNQNFFGLNSGFKGVTGNNLYTNMSEKYAALGYIEGRVPLFRQVAYPGLVTATTSLSGSEHAAEGQKAFTKVAADEGKEKEAFATKRVSISFRSGEFLLDENSKYIIDKEFVDIAKAFGNSRIRIEGNTDNVGNRASNIALSQKRAQSVANYLAQAHSMSSNRFIVVGNGPDKPVGSNSAESGRAQNRRTDFELVRD